MVAGSRSGVGKTTVASCLIALLAEAGARVRAFKLGPDFIDSGRHALLAGSPCVNLDRFLCAPPGRDAEADDLLRRRFLSALDGHGAGIVEAVGGFLDDWYGTGESPADIARILGVPVLLVCDGRASCQTAGVEAAALIAAASDRGARVIGVVFPEVSSAEHLARIRAGAPSALGGRLLLMLPRAEALAVSERHLGLVTGAEAPPDRAAFAAAARPHLPVGDIMRAAGAVPVPDAPSPGADRTGDRPRPDGFTLALARDEAFSFYYPDNLEALEDAGARIVEFSPLRDRALPDADLVMLGGGFPELYAERLSANAGMRESVRAAAGAGMPVYAECGGLMYLCSSLETPDGRSFPLAGVYPFAARFGGLVIGYAEAETAVDCLLGPAGTRARGHVFHRSALEGADAAAVGGPCAAVGADHTADSSGPGGPQRVLRLRRRGDDAAAPLEEGWRAGGALGTWVHLCFASAPGVPLAMATAARSWRARRGGLTGA
jgi:cobyrinic acid a,c-diamide synthase